MAAKVHKESIPIDTQFSVRACWWLPAATTARRNFRIGSVSSPLRYYVAPPPNRSPSVLNFLLGLVGDSRQQQQPEGFFTLALCPALFLSGTLLDSVVLLMYVTFVRNYSSSYEEVCCGWQQRSTGKLHMKRSVDSGWQQRSTRNRSPSILNFL